jgi:uncharacterized damage-inducible protein DinB
MSELDEHGRRHPPLTGDELSTLVGFLDYQRATFEWKTREVDAAGLAARLGQSELSLGGLLKHMAYVEDSWFSRRLHGNRPAVPWDTVDWSADRDWEFHTASEDSPEELHNLWQNAVGRSRRLLDDALDGGGLDQLAEQGWSADDRPSLRWILCHMIEEYARHNGHADLLREQVDGAVGE